MKQQKMKIGKVIANIIISLLFLSTVRSVVMFEKKNMISDNPIHMAYAETMLSESDYNELLKKAEEKQKKLNEVASLKATITVKDMEIEERDKLIKELMPEKEEIIYNEEIDRIVEKISKEYKVDKYMIHAIIKTESNYNPQAISKVGACGLMQLMPKTAETLGVKGMDIWDKEKNIRAGIKHYKNSLKKFNGNIPLALAGYNAGDNAVIRYGGIPPYKETLNYVPKVLKNYKKIIS